nr:ChaN family lipoprotein [uncultured Caldimonas sp.]
MTRLLIALALVWPAFGFAQQALLFGERHDHADHQRQTAESIRRLADQGRLHAVVLEMADRGRSTSGLGARADEAAVREALAWSDAGWPWARYREVVMNAVRAGVPVYGGNLPRPLLREAMQQARWEDLVPADARARLLEAVREGHCNLLPESQLAPMLRMQVARDFSLAQAVAGAAEGAIPNSVIVLLAGAAHVSRETGVPVHLGTLAVPLEVRTIGYASSYAEQAEPGFDEWRPAQSEPPQDHCAALRERGMPGAPAASAPKQP